MEVVDKSTEMRHKLNENHLLTEINVMVTAHVLALITIGNSGLEHMQLWGMCFSKFALIQRFPKILFSLS